MYPAKLKVKRSTTWDDRGTLHGARLHNEVIIETQGKGSLWIREWGMNCLQIFVHGGEFSLNATSGNTFVLEWLRGPERILLPAMMEEDS